MTIGKILVLNAIKAECTDFCALLSQQDYEGFPVYSIEELIQSLQGQNVMAVLMDIDSINIENRIIRDFTIKFPNTYFLAMSKNRFHPELKEAICYHIYACLNKPVDQDELFYWLKSIRDDTGYRYSPGNI